MKNVLLISIGGLGNGGVQKVMYEITQNLNDEFHFDIVCFSVKNDYYKEKFLKHGQIYYILFSYKRFSYYFRQIKLFVSMMKILKQKQYDIIHCHNKYEAGICCFAAYCCGVKVRIVHSHWGFEKQKKNIFSRMFNNFLRLFIYLYATVLVGCSQEANRYLFKKRTALVIPNFVDLKEFDFNKRVNFGTNNFIHVGKLCEGKNQVFIINVFKYIHESLKDSKLTLIGDGEIKGKLLKMISDYKLKDSVRIMPGDTKVSNELAKNDYFIFPSKSEGFGIALLEAQAMKLDCFVSDRVPEESDIGLCNYLSLESGEKYWAEYIVGYINGKKRKHLDPEKLQEYSLSKFIGEIRKIYMEEKE